MSYYDSFKRITINPKFFLYLILGSAFAVFLASLTTITPHSLALLHKNLLLAWVPLFAALLGRVVKEIPYAGYPFWLILLVVWIFFLPNSFYVVTDFVHLGEAPGALFWLKNLTLYLSATISLLAGVYSVELVRPQLFSFQRLHLWWLFNIIVSFLVGVGVYLGRFSRLNSWDVLEPAKIAESVKTLLDQHLVISEWGFVIIFSFIALIFINIFHSLISRTIGE